MKKTLIISLLILSSCFKYINKKSLEESEVKTQKKDFENTIIEDYSTMEATWIMKSLMTDKFLFNTILEHFGEELINCSSGTMELKWDGLFPEIEFKECLVTEAEECLCIEECHSATVSGKLNVSVESGKIIIKTIENEFLRIKSPSLFDKECSVFMESGLQIASGDFSLATGTFCDKGVEEIIYLINKIKIHDLSNNEIDEIKGFCKLDEYNIEDPSLCKNNNDCEEGKLCREDGACVSCITSEDCIGTGVNMCIDGTCKTRCGNTGLFYIMCPYVFQTCKSGFCENNINFSDYIN